MHEPVVYYKPGCPFGIRLRAALTVHRVPHRSVRLRDDEDGAAEVRAVNDGLEISPTVRIGTQWLTNPGWREVRDATSTAMPHSAPPWKLSIVSVVGIVLIALASVLLAGCGSNGEASPDEPPTPQPTAASSLEGTWRTEPIALRDVEATLRQHGLEKWIEKFRTDPPFADNTVLILDVKDEWDLYGETDEGGPREEIDYDADYRIEGDTVEVTHSTGSTTHRWSVDGERLTLEWLSTTQPPYNGVPDEVYQRALYMTAAFTRQD